MRLIFIIFLSFIITITKAEFSETTLQIFQNEKIQFLPDSQWNIDSMIHLSNGRLILKTIQLPERTKETEIKLNLTLKSLGDRWDKSGSCFLLPKNEKINFINISKKQETFPGDNHYNKDYPGILSENGYTPVLELLRFMTPFGVGAFNDSMENRRPVYIPFWEKQVTWEENISQFSTLLQGEVTIGIWIDTWTKEGYEISLKLIIKESLYPCALEKPKKVIPLINTVYYISPQKQVHELLQIGIPADIDIPDHAKNIQLYYITTGHGGHSGGDEFVKKENKIFIDGQEIFSVIPWRDDCSSFRRFNPGSGLWLIQDTTEYINWEKGGYETKIIEERLASSDLSRSNWCPGSKVSPYIIPIQNIQGRRTITFQIPKAQKAVGDKLNHWLISAYLVYELAE